MAKKFARNSPLRQQSRRSYSKLKLVTILILLVVILIGGFIETNRYKSSHKATAINQIQSGFQGFCIDLYRDKQLPNSTIDEWGCNGTTAQEWVIENNNIVHGSNTCLSIANNGTDQGDQIVANKCNGSQGQIWVSAIDGLENPNSALCLSAANGSEGTNLELASCNNLTQPQEAWMQSIWNKNSANTSASTSCSGTVGQLVACYAAKQLVIWQSNTISHSSLLNTYSDGNGYEEWCADFVSYIYKESGYPFVDGERNGWDEYDADNVQYEPDFTYHAAGNYIPQEGDIAYFNYSGGHVEIVAVGGSKPIFIYGDSGTIDPTTKNGQMTENTITNDGSAGQVIYYLSPN